MLNSDPGIQKLKVVVFVMVPTVDRGFLLALFGLSKSPVIGPLESQHRVYPSALELSGVGG